MAVDRPKKRSNFTTTTAHHPLLLLLLQLFYHHTLLAAAAAAANGAPVEILRGFSASPSTASAPTSSPFQPLLYDPSRNFSMGFLLLGADRLDLAVVHLPSSFPVWRATPSQLAFARSTSLSFDGRLVLSDPVSGVLWSAQSDGPGDRLLLQSSSNLQIRNQTALVWQSFDFPSDTIVQDQNFTSASVVFSTNSRFSMRLGPNYLGLHMYLGGGQAQPMYWKQTALEARAQIVVDKGPIYARVNASGFLGMYQEEGPPVHVMPFDTYNRGIVSGLLRLTLEPDGNLRGYYWNGTFWVPDFAAISNTCDLPTSCGAYGLCHRQGTGGGCGCLNDEGNRTTGSAGGTCLPEDTGDLCSSSSSGGGGGGGGGGGNGSDSYWVVRRRAVDLAYKEMVGFVKVASMEECEERCERNCSCWGAIYSNASGACYAMDFPIETLVGEGGEGKMGYFKVRSTVGRQKGWRRRTAAFRAGMALLVVGMVLLLGISAVGAYRVWRRWRPTSGRSNSSSSLGGEGLSPVPYKDLKDSPSFRSVELSVSSSSSLPSFSRK